MTIKTEQVYTNRDFSKAVKVEIGMIAVIEGRRGYVTNLGRKYIEVLLYNGPRKKKLVPTEIEFTGEFHY
jgi:hypothetical protein